MNTSCNIQGVLFLPCDDSRSTMKQYCFSLCLNNCLLMHTRPTVDWGFYGHCQDLKQVCLGQRIKEMTFWETGVGLWSTAHFVYNSGRSGGGARGAEKKIFWRPVHPPPLCQGLLTAPLASEGLDLPLYNNIATTHLCLQSLCLPCSPCRGKILRYFESQNLRLALCFFSGWNRI